MASINIDKDLKAAVDAKRLTHPEAWELRDLRKGKGRLEARIDTLESKIAPLREELVKLLPRLNELEDKAEAGPVAVEPKGDE